MACTRILSEPVLNSERTTKGPIQNWLKDTVVLYYSFALMLLKVAIITYPIFSRMMHMLFWGPEVIVFILKLYIAFVRTWYVLHIETLSSLKWRRENQSENWFWSISFMICGTILKPRKKPNFLSFLSSQGVPEECIVVILTNMLKLYLAF